MAAAKNRQPDRTPYGIGRLVGITYRKVQTDWKTNSNKISRANEELQRTVER